MEDSEFVMMLIEQIKDEVTKEIRSHETAADEVERELAAYTSNIQMAMLDYRSAIKETLRERTLARIRRQPEPESRVENAALALVEAVESLTLRSVVDRLPEFRKTSPKKAEETTRHVTTAPVVTTDTYATETQIVPLPALVTQHAADVTYVTCGEESVESASDEQKHEAWSDAHKSIRHRTEDPEETQVSATGNRMYENLAAHSETHPLLFAGGTPENRKLEWLKKEFDINAVWNQPRKGQHVEHSIGQIRSRKFCAVAFFVGYSSHEHSRSVKEACRESNTPYVVLHGAGVQQIKKVCEEIDGILLRRELDENETKS